MKSPLLILLIVASAQLQASLAHPKPTPQVAASQSVSGTIRDPSGAAIPRAQVDLTKLDGTTLARTCTNDMGSFHFDNVSSGKYRVVARADGFRDTKIDVTVGSKPNAVIRLSLPIAAQTEAVTVGGTLGAGVSTDIAENQSSNTLDRNALDRVPVFDQDDITAISRFLDNTATGTNGVALVMNGVEANGPGVTASAIQEVKVNQNPYSALFARPGRARLEITTHRRRCTGPRG